MGALLKGRGYRPGRTRPGRPKGSTFMGERAAILIVALLAVSTGVLVLPKPVAAAVDDLALSGQIYYANGVFLGSNPVDADATPFIVRIWHGSPPSSRDYPSPTVPCDVGGLPISPGTCRGWYTILIPSGDKGTYWDFGDEYQILVDAPTVIVPPGYIAATSYDNGSWYDNNPANGVKDAGEPLEYTGLGNLTNTIAWRSDDNFQQWDVQLPAVDYVPVDCVAGSVGLCFDGVPVTGPISVPLSSTHNVSFRARNQGTTLMNVTSNSTAKEILQDLVGMPAPGSPWVTPPVSAVTTAPTLYVGNWTAPPTSGNTTLCVMVDANGDVSEMDETNNEECVEVGVALPDLVPTTVWANVSSAGEPGSPFSWQSTCPTLTIDTTQTLHFTAIGSNLAIFDTGVGTFRITMYNVTDCGTSSNSRLRIATPFFTSPVLGPLGAFGQTPPQNQSWPTPAVAGARFVNVTVDPEPPAGGNVAETNEANNSITFLILVGGPDLVPAPVTVNGVPTGNLTLSIGQTADLLGQVTNVEQATNTSFTFQLYESNSVGVRTGALRGEQVIPGLGAGATSAPTLDYTFLCNAPGNNYFTYAVDTNSTVFEVFESNNLFVIHVVCQGPDLIPANLLVNGNPQVAPYPCISVPVGGTVIFGAWAENIGANSTGGGFSVTFTNSTTPTSPFLNQSFSPLGSGNTTLTNATISWNSTTLFSNVTYSINITVDALGEIQEVDEANNWVVLRICIGGLADVAVSSFTLQQTAAVSPATLNLVAGQVLRIGTQVTNLGLVSAASFDVVLCQGAGQAPGLPVFTVGSLIPPETRGPYEFVWRAPLLPPLTSQQTYTFRVVADFDTGGDSCDLPVGVIVEPDDGIANNNVFRVTVNVFELPPAPDVRLAVVGNTANVSWTPPAGWPAPVSYAVYGGSRPETIDFTTPLGPATAGTWFTHTDGLLSRDEFYYVVRSVDANNWEGSTSAIVGTYARAFPVGYSSFSLPLKPFPEAGRTASHWTSQVLTSSWDTIYEFNETADHWTGHPKGLDAINPTRNNFVVEFGRSYEVYRSTFLAAYRFVGYPATMTSYLDGENGDPRVGADGTFRDSLAVSLVDSGANLRIEWATASNRSADETVGWYHVHRSQSRSSFDLTAAPAHNASAVYNATALSWTDPAPTCSVGQCEWYYTVMPVNSAGRRGSSTFSVSVILVRLTAGYNHIALPLNPEAAQTARGVLAGLPGTAAGTAFNLTTTGWKGHSLGMPSWADDFRPGRSYGFTHYVRTAATVIWIGR